LPAEGWEPSRWVHPTSAISRSIKRTVLARPDSTAGQIIEAGQVQLARDELYLLEQEAPAAARVRSSRTARYSGPSAEAIAIVGGVRPARSAAEFVSGIAR
jgi:hypothetical protein